jgi:hypothetical protein
VHQQSISFVSALTNLSEMEPKAAPQGISGLIIKQGWSEPSPTDTLYHDELSYFDSTEILLGDKLEAYKLFGRLSVLHVDHSFQNWTGCELGCEIVEDLLIKVWQKEGKAFGETIHDNKS